MVSRTISHFLLPNNLGEGDMRVVYSKLNAQMGSLGSIRLFGGENHAVSEMPSRDSR